MLFVSLLILNFCPGLRPVSRTSLPSRRTILVKSVMGGYQYQSRASKLRSKGVDVYEFGNRNLREGCFGEDVLQLQNWLADETYYNPVDGGYTGYFGSVTKEALQAWQRDTGLEATGCFDSASKSAYLRSLEMRTAEAAQVASSFIQGATAAVPTVQATPVGGSSASGAPFFAAAAVLAGIAFARLATPVLRRAKSTVVNVFTSKKAEAVEYQAADAATNNAACSEHYYEEDEEAYHAATTTQETTNHSSRLRRLSDEELQRYIAPFKGAATTGSKKSFPVIGRPTPQRPIPRRSLNLKTGTSKETATPNSPQAPVTTRHGTYYGGRQVLDRVKEYLAEEGSMPPAPGAAGQRMQKLGYNMRPNSTPTTSPNTTATTSSPAPTPGSGPRTIAEAQREYQQSAKIVSPLQMANNTNNGNTSSFEDIPEAEFSRGGVATAVAVAPPRQSQATSQALLTGTELEAAPESPLRPVPVKRGDSTTRKAPVATASAAAAAVKPARKAAPRPVAVVKPSRGGEQETADVAAPVVQAPVDPNSAVVLTNKPVKLHKPARLANRSVDYSSMSDEE
jgi:peptidoglycan hydrolase-like protein with peptidoglycan-binding domain